MRKLLFKIHRYLALAAMVPVLLITLTGAVLVFKQPIDQWLLADKMAIAHQGETRQPLDRLLTRVETALPDYEVGSWELFYDGEKADRVYVIRHGTDQWYKATLNPYTGELLGTPVPLDHDLTDWLLELHYTLLLNDLWQTYPQLGTVVGLVAAVILCVLGISGLIIYRKFWRGLFTLPRDRRPKIFNRKLHRFVGVWCSPVLLILGVTGLYFNVVELMEETGEAHEHHVMTGPLYGQQIDLESLWHQSRRALPGFRPTYLLMPWKPGLPITFFGRVEGVGMLTNEYSSSVSFDARSGAHQHTHDIREAAFTTRVFDSFRKLHFGDFAGVTSRVIWSLTGIAIAIMAVTGLLMWLGARRGKVKTGAPAAAASASRQPTPDSG